MAENYFRLTSLEDGNQISIKAVDSPSAVNLQYRTSIDQTWQAYAIGTLISLSTNEWIEFRNDTGTFSKNNRNYYNVTMTKAAGALGSIMSLLDYNNMDMAVPEFAFYRLFRNCSTLRESPALPATTLGKSCYQGMFNGCTSLTQAPELPATTLAEICYHSMFQGCTSLTTAPELPATTLVNFCYPYMFNGCTSLTQAPALPAMTLTESCYANMFNGCTSLTQAPELPATTLADSCYFNMFNGCTSLTKAPDLPATNLQQKCYHSMFQGCTSLMTAPELPATTLVNFCYPYMFSGCTSLTTAPALPATTLASSCYTQMFNNCPKIDRIVWKSITIPSSTYCSNWLNGASASGKFEYTDPTLDVASITRDNNGVPAGWSISLLSPETKLLLKINNASIDNISLLGKKIASLSINGKKVKSSSGV